MFNEQIQEIAAAYASCHTEGDSEGGRKERMFRLCKKEALAAVES